MNRSDSDRGRSPPAAATQGRGPRWFFRGAGAGHALRPGAGRGPPLRPARLAGDGWFMGSLLSLSRTHWDHELVQAGSSRRESAQISPIKNERTHVRCYKVHRPCVRSTSLPGNPLCTCIASSTHLSCTLWVASLGICILVWYTTGCRLDFALERKPLGCWASEPGSVTGHPFESSRS